MQINIPEPMSIMDYIPDAYRILIYGIAGTGKTEFAATWAELGNVLYIDSGRGILTVKSSPRIKDELKQRIYFVPVNDKSPDPHVKRPIGWLTIKSIAQSLLNDGTYGKDKFKPDVVVLDELTAATEMSLTNALFENGHVGQQPTQPDYGKQQRQLIDFINTMKERIGLHFICTAHEYYEKDELSGRIWCLPQTIGQLRSNISGYFDEVYHARVNQTKGGHEYLLDTKPTGIITAKTRLDLPTPIQAHYNSVKGSLERLQQAEPKAV
jgi:adenosyl cobinamide kinase/adenosyl cobinamide phosphate guanylyltransferase